MTRFLALVVSIAVSLLAGCAESALQSAQLKPVHLKGLAGVNVIVFVDRGVDGFAVLETALHERVRATLAERGLSSDSRQDVTLSVEAITYPTGSLTTPDVSLLTVRVELSEAVQLRRDPTLKIPGGNGAVTWSRGWALLELKANLAVAIEREVLSQVQDFAAEVSYANR